MRVTGLRLVGVVVGLVAPCLANPPSPQDILHEAQVAMAGLRAVRYQARGEAAGAMSFRIPKMAGTVTLVRVPPGDNMKVRVDAEVAPPMHPQTIALELASDGKEVTAAEHGSRMYYHREWPAGALLLSNVGPLLVGELTAAQPFLRETRAASIDHAGSERVGDTDCDVVHAVLSPGGEEVRWFIAKTDHLPRRVQRIIPSPAGPTTVTTTLTSLDTQPVVDEQTFRLEKPQGFLEPPPAGPGAGGEQLLPVGSEAPDWTLKDASGNAVTLKSLRGKVVVLDFWATWCGPCRQAMPGVQKLHEKYKDKPVLVYGVNCLERGPSDPMGIIKKAGFTYPQLLNGTDVATAYHVMGIPCFYVIGADGKILTAYSGFSPDTERLMEAAIEKGLQAIH